MVDGGFEQEWGKKNNCWVLFSLQVGERSTSPRWDEGFYFLVRDPKEETLTVKVISSVSVSF